MEAEIRQYEAQNKTGNKVLDTVLTSKSLYCNKNGITFTCVADGTLLDFMDVMDEKLRILLCEDDENLGMLLREYLQAKGYAAELYPDGEAGYKAFLKNKYDLCVE